MSRPAGAQNRLARRIGMRGEFFTEVPERIRYGGPESSDPLSYAAYQPERELLWQGMAAQLRGAVCLWHSVDWPGVVVFGVGPVDRAWLSDGPAVATATAPETDA